MWWDERVSGTSSPLRSYRPGTWFGLIGERALVALPPTEKARVAALWELVDEGAGFDITLDALISAGLRDLPGFVLVSEADGEIPRAHLARAERGHLGPQLVGLQAQLRVALALRHDEVAHVGVAISPQISASGRQRRHRHHEARQNADKDGGHPSATGPVPELVLADVGLHARHPLLQRAPQAHGPTVPAAPPSTDSKAPMWANRRR